MNIPQYLVNEYYDDRYFDVVNALDEAKLIYFDGCNILNVLSAESAVQREFRIGETGFGAGRLFLSLMDFMDKRENVGKTISYNSVELHPITSARMDSILQSFKPRIGPLINLLVESYDKLDITKPGWRQLEFTRSFGTITLNLWIGEALEMVNSLPNACDAWFLDGHGPKKNPTIWRPELLMAIGEKTVLQGTCATYTVAGAVRRALASAGFTVERVPGFGGKNSVLKGVKTNEGLPEKEILF